MIIPTLTFVYDRRGRASRTNPAPVELSVYVARKRKYITTGIKLLPKEWSNGSVSACRPDYMELNDQLHAIKKKVSEVVTDMISQGNFDLNALPDLLNRKVQQQETFIEFAEDYVNKSKKKKVREKTMRRYKVVFDFLKQWKGIVRFSDVTEEKIVELDDVLTSRGLKECSRWNYHKVVKMCAKQAVKEDKLKKNPYDMVEIDRGDSEGLTRYLTPEEFHKFEKCKIPTESLERVRDMFVFQTYTMLAYTDFAAFSWDKVVEVNGEYVYKAKRQKTKQEFVIVLLPQALEILEKYKYKLPMISNVKYNLYLKAAVKYAKIDKPVTTHYARHTGATLLLNEGGLPMHIVQHILGHASIRETEKTYAKVLDSTVIESMAGYGKHKRKVTKKGKVK